MLQNVFVINLLEIVQYDYLLISSQSNRNILIHFQTQFKKHSKSLKTVKSLISEISPGKSGRVLREGKCLLYSQLHSLRVISKLG